MYQFSITTHLAIRCTSGLKDNKRKFTKQDTKQPAEGATKLSKTKHYNNESPTHILPQAKII